MKEKTKVKAEFLIRGKDINVDDISQQLKIIPTTSYNKNSINVKTPISKKEGKWELATELESSLDINIQLNKLISLLKGKEKKLLSIKKTYQDCEYTFCLLIEIYEETSPAIYLEKNTLSFINEINAELDVDLYVIRE